MAGIWLDALDWSVRLLSFFNTIAYLWLGLTVLLNAERRDLGTWAVGGGLLLAGLFFAGHSTLVGRDLSIFYQVAARLDLEFWWRAGWLLFVVPPYLWYLTVAWYSSLLGVHPYQRRLLTAGLLGLALAALLGLPNLLPTYAALAQGAPVEFLRLGTVPVAALVYPAYSTLCFALALATLRRPAAPKRFMGDLARRRAHPWLEAASLTLLVVSLSMGGIASWVLYWAQSRQVALFSKPTLTLLLGLDLAVSGLLALVSILLGRAIVSYEIFTGKALPRGLLFSHWRNSLILAAAYGGVLAASLAFAVDPVYRLLLATILMAVFYALLTWRTFVEREQSIAHLRPFVASQRLYEHLLRPTTAVEVDVVTPFRALCADLLGARVAYLVALGPLGPLAGPPLAYPSGPAPSAPDLSSLVGQLGRSQRMCVPVDPGRFGGARWAVPLWSERGLIGALLLGEKRDGGLYVQEEIEIARAVGERLIDNQASAEMSRRLLALQRQRLAESQVLDRRARRLLHDDVLPRLHTAMLLLSSKPGESAGEAVEMLTGIHRSISDLLRELPVTLAPEVAHLGLVGALRRTVEDELSGAFDSVTWHVEPEAGWAAETISKLAAEVLFCAAREAIRNAAQHARAQDVSRRLHLSVEITWRAGLNLTVEDDGVGLDGTGQPPGGSGQGLALHSTLMAVIGGTLSAESRPHGGTRVSLVLPQEAALRGVAANGPLVSDAQLPTDAALRPE